MTGYVENVVDSADDPEIAVWILAATIACEVTPFYLAPVDVLETLRITPNAAEHAWPWLSNHQFAATVFGDDLAFVIHHFRQDAKERKSSATRLGGRGAGQRCDHDAARFGLPPRINDGATLATDHFPVPDPGF